MLLQPSSEELLARVVGQSQDVTCELEVVAGGSSCAELASAHGAQAVLRVREPEPGGAYEVVVCDAASGAEQTRAVPTEHVGQDALGASAAYEAVALVVRSALVDLATEHDARQEERRQQALEAERVREAAAARDARAREARAREAAAQPREADDEAEDEADGDDAIGKTRRLPVWLILAGGEIAWIAAGPPALDFTARALTALGPLRIGAGGSYGFASRLERSGARLDIARHTVVLIATMPIQLSSFAMLDIGVQAGAAAFTRSTLAGALDVTAAGAATRWSAVFGLELGTSLPIAGPLGLRLHLAADVVPAAPRYALETDAGSGPAAPRTQLGSPAYVQPRAGITFFVAL